MARVSAPNSAPTPLAPIRMPSARAPPCRTRSVKIGIRKKRHQHGIGHGDQADEPDEQHDGHDWRCAAHEAKSFGDVFYGCGLFRDDSHRTKFHQERADDDSDVADGVGEKTPAFTDPRYKQTGYRRAYYTGAVEHGGIQGDRVHQVVPADHIDQKRLPGRNIKCVHGTEQSCENHNLPDGDDVEKSKDCEDACENHRRDLRADDDAMAIPAVCRHAANGSEQEHGYLPRETYDAQKERRSRQAINQPGLRNVLHPGADKRDQLSAEEKLEVAMPQRSDHVAGSRALFGFFRG